MRIHATPTKKIKAINPIINATPLQITLTITTLLITHAIRLLTYHCHTQVRIALS